MRLIDADALDSKAVKLLGYGENKYVLLKAIHTAPTVDAEPVKHAHWIDAGYYETTAYGSNDFYTCSACKQDTEFGGDGDYDYCPHCGAKMDEEVKDEHH